MRWIFGQTIWSGGISMMRRSLNSPPPPDPGDALLLEGGDFILLENGDKILMEA